MSTESQTAWLIDVTSMYRILNELDEQKEITAVIDVRDEQLATITDMAIQTDLPNDQGELVIEMLKDGRLKVFTHSSQNYIPPMNAVHCVRLPPIYYVKDLKKKYE